jgi:hypothetical protein
VEKESEVERVKKKQRYFDCSEVIAVSESIFSASFFLKLRHSRVQEVSKEGANSGNMEPSPPGVRFMFLALQ